MNYRQGNAQEEGFKKLTLVRVSLLHGLASVSVVLGSASLFAQSTQPAVGSNQASLADAVARVIENAIPREYERSKDWGSTKNITVGLRRDGWEIHRRKKPVNHGTWKHYRVRLVEPERTLKVRIENLRVTDAGKIGFTLSTTAKLDLWARVKRYHYGVHLIALEIVGDASIALSMDCEIDIRWHTHDGQAGAAIDPRVTDARLDIADFHLRRISNAHGPLVREIGGAFPRLIKDELQGPKFIAKLNRAIDKRRDQLELSFQQLWK